MARLKLRAMQLFTESPLLFLLNLEHLPFQNTSMLSLPNEGI